jgi:methionine synthase II (cobalamin-independent)
MKKTFLLVWCLSIFSRAHSIVSPELYKINHMIYSKYDTLGKYKQWFEPNVFSLIEHSKPYEELKEIQEDIKVNVGNNVVKTISAALPHVDNIGHNILHANNIFINDILNNPILDHDTQKAIILFSIKLAQHGDDMGSYLLQTYYNIVDYSL